MSHSGRLATRILTAIEVRDLAAPDAGPWLTRDLSATGLFLLAPGHWAVGDGAELVLAHGTWRLVVRARAVQATAEGVGLTFVEPPAALDAALVEIISERFAAGDRLAERRHETRWGHDTPVTWRAGGEEHAARVRNLSMGGAGLAESTATPEVGSIIYVLFPLCCPAGGDPIFFALMGCRARVIAHTPFGFGVEYLEPSEAFRQNLLRALAQAGST